MVFVRVTFNSDDALGLVARLVVGHHAMGAAVHCFLFGDEAVAVGVDPAEMVANLRIDFAAKDDAVGHWRALGEGCGLRRRRLRQERRGERGGEAGQQ